MVDPDISELNKPYVDWVIVADRAEVVNGKLYLMGGGWDVIHAADITKPIGISFAVGVVVPWNATNQEHAVAISLVDDNGNAIDSGERVAKFNMGRPPFLGVGDSQRVIIAVPGEAIIFPGAGTYTIGATVDGANGRETVFRVHSAHT
jgi:uncharacterized protein DUF6941